MPIIGTQQSPIKIMHNETFYTNFDQSYFEIRKYAVNGDVPGVLDEYNFELTTPVKGLTYQGNPWYLHRIHFHAPAEHLVNSDKPNYFEVHLIHYQSDKLHASGPKVVIAGMFEVEKTKSKTTTPRDSFARLNKIYTESQCAVRNKTKKYQMPDEKPLHRINPNDFLPECTHHWYHYQGSLTSGTYSEDVAWFILVDRYQVPEKDLSFLCETKQDARHVFPLDRRFVLRSFE